MGSTHEAVGGNHLLDAIESKLAGASPDQIQQIAKVLGVEATEPGSSLEDSVVSDALGESQLTYRQEIDKYPPQSYRE